MNGGVGRLNMSGSLPAKTVMDDLHLPMQSAPLSHLNEEEEKEVEGGIGSILCTYLSEPNKSTFLR